MSQATEQTGNGETFANTQAGAAEAGPPYYITKEEELELRLKANRGVLMNGIPTSMVIGQPASFDDYVRQLMIPTRVLELARKASSIRFSAWEAEAIRASIAPGDGVLRWILEQKASKDSTHPPYIRVACTGVGDYDKKVADRYGYKAEGPAEPEHVGDFGSPVVLELWPAQHYSPLHSHGKSTGIIYSLVGQVEFMAYGSLAWDAKKVGLVTLTPGQCAWLDGDRFAVHKVYCPMDGGPKPVGPGNLLNDSSNYAATFHVYVNKGELPLLTTGEPKEETRDIFDYIDEEERGESKRFTTYSDISWRVLRKILADYASRIGM